MSEALTDAYVVTLFVAMYGWATVSGIREYLGSPEVQQTDPGERYWTAVAALIAGAGLAWQGLRAIGPLQVTPAAQTWVVSSPVDRRGWLQPWFAGLLCAAGAALGLLGLAAALSGGTDRPADLAWAALAAAAPGALLVALGVVAQSAGRTPRWAAALGPALAATGAALALMVILRHFFSTPVDRPSVSLTAGVALVALPVTVPVIRRASRALPRVDRASLTTGTQFTAAVATAAVLLDPSQLAALVESRRWRSVGRVHSRPFRPGGRFRVLVQAELRRPVRHPSAIIVWAALLLASYAVAVALPSIEQSAHIVLAYLATGRLAGGLRAISRSPGLRRSLGGHDIVLRLAHLVVPAVGALIWYAATLPVIRTGPGGIDALLLIGVIAAAYRAGTRPPMRYDGVVVDSPFGMIPVDLVRQILRGPDLVAVLVVLQLTLGS